MIILGKLARSLNDCEALPQSGMCCIAVARCEQSLSNQITEVTSMIEAGRKFIKVSSNLRVHSLK